MKILRIITVILFSLVIILPLINFNFEQNAVSEIDNRKLATDPLSAEGDLTENIQNYVSDRIGFRNDMILAYTVLNDKLFKKMVHPSYTYGTDGYVFGAGVTVNNSFGDFHIQFADMVKKIQDYCDQRCIPFLFVFDPAKPALYTEYLAEGIHYNRDWVESFFDELDKRNVRYIDNTDTLNAKKAAGEMVFNQKYDANHWNDLGAYYGTNAILQALKKELPNVHVNTWEDITVSQKLQTSLLVSNFPIEEYVPEITVNTEYISLKEKYADELELHASYRNFNDYINETRQKENAPSALVFQGSYMNSYGYKYLANGFSEYIHVHDYQNILRFPYYLQIFDPDCVVFEVAEYTFSNTYFDYQKMQDIRFNPTFASTSAKAESIENTSVALNNLIIERGEALTKITWQAEASAEYVWLLIADREFDMERTTDGYTTTILNTDYTTEDLKIATCKGQTITIYTVE